LERDLKQLMFLARYVIAFFLKKFIISLAADVNGRRIGGGITKDEKKV
jgi:hypothetical protein